MKTILTIILIAFGSFNLFARSSKITKEEYAVYSKIFESLYEKRKVAADFQLVISDNTVKKTFNSGTPESRLSHKSDAAQLYNDFSQQKIEELVENYNERNSSSALIKERFKTKYSYFIISQYELDKLLIIGKKLYDEMLEKPVDELHSSMAIWKPFLNKYHTDGCYTLSRVGFSKNKKLALVLVSRTNGISGDDVFYILEKSDGQWLNPKWFGFGISWII